MKYFFSKVTQGVTFTVAPLSGRQITPIQTEVIIHEATSLSVKFDFKHLDRSFAQTNKLRTIGTDNLLAAAKEAGVRRFIAQSYATYRYARSDGWVKTEADPLDPNPLPVMKETYDAMSYLDKAVTEAGGVALRYGGFYGDPSNETERTGLLEPVRKGKFRDCHVESFHGRFKKEYVWTQELNSFQDADKAISEAFIDYNQRRPHSALGYLSPYEFLSRLGVKVN